MSGALIRYLKGRIGDLEIYVRELEEALEKAAQLGIDKGGPEGPPPPTHDARVPQRSDEQSKTNNGEAQ